MVSKKINLFILSVICLILLSCSSKKEVFKTETTGDFREELLDTLYLSDSEPSIDTVPKVYRPAATTKYDLLHTKLDIRFDWQKQHVLGKAELLFTPYFYPLQSVEFDAVNFDLHSVRLMPGNKNLMYKYDGEKIILQLDREYKKGEKILVLIDYTAKPEETVDAKGEAISSDKGLFFINALGKEKNKPQQIWTQGETENNKKWFPTFDKPNERCSQEIYLTVEDRFKTLSNGKLISSTRNADGTRTDYWSQQLPHAPYLFMIAVGEFHVETELWNQVPVHYYVEKGFKKSAKKIFNHTPEMLTFFSDKLQHTYPWDKYAQIVVRDFVSGAMENTSAVVFGEFVQKTERELIDNDNDYIVAHELMHHWFGNMVTCEDWSQLTLNEGFANYAEYLWFEQKYGRERADYHRLTEMNGYFSQAYSQGAHPLIHYYYGNKEDMFDAHSYNKGGLVLHMLRNYVGDEAFFAALNKYLKDNAFTAVEIDELRLAFEDTIGQDLSWFFNQWYEQSGHPTFDVQYEYSPETKSLLVKVQQTQDSMLYPSIFQMPLEIATYWQGEKVEYHSFFMDKRHQNFLIEDLDQKPLSVVFDGKNDILGLINETKSEEEYIAQYKNSKLFGDKVIALSNITDKNSILEDLFKEKFFYLRSLGIESITEEMYPGFVDQLQNFVLFDPHSQVRTSALQVLLSNGEEEIIPLLKRVAEAEQAYPVVGLALEGLSYFDIEVAERYADLNIKDSSPYIINSLMTVFASSKKEKYIDYFHDQLTNISTYQLFDYFEKYMEFLEGQNFSSLKKSVEFLTKVALDGNEDSYKKFFSVNSMIKIREWVKASDHSEKDDFSEDISRKIDKVKLMETDPVLKLRYAEIESN